MTRQGSPRERRAELRRTVPASRIAWAGERADKTHAGWISDVALSSIAFVTPTRDEPRPGEAIELTFDAGTPLSRHCSARVARIAPKDRLFSLVACRTEPDD